MILIEHNGERLHVSDLDGYPGAVVIERDVDPPPSDCCRRENGEWVECPVLKSEEKARRLARGRAMLGEELIEEIVREVLARVQTANLSGDGKV